MSLYMQAIMEEDAVAECAVVGIKDQLKGQVPLGLCIMKERKFLYIKIALQ